MRRWIENTIRVIVYGPFALIALALFGYGVYSIGQWAIEDGRVPEAADANHGVPIDELREQLAASGESVDPSPASSPKPLPTEYHPGQPPSEKPEKYYDHIGWKVWEGGKAIGCKSQDTHGKLASLQSSGDMTAFKRELIRQVAQGDCVAIESGKEVYLEVVDYGLWKLRPRGSPDGYWFKASKEVLPTK